MIAGQVFQERSAGDGRDPSVHGPGQRARDQVAVTAAQMAVSPGSVGGAVGVASAAMRRIGRASGGGGDASLIWRRGPRAEEARAAYCSALASASRQAASRAAAATAARSPTTSSSPWTL